MNLTPEETSMAAAQGWQLCEVYDADKRKCSLEVLPLDFERASRAGIMLELTRRAKSGDALAIKAMTLVARSNLYGRTK